MTPEKLAAHLEAHGVTLGPLTSVTLGPDDTGKICLVVTETASGDDAELLAAAVATVLDSLGAGTDVLDGLELAVTGRPAETDLTASLDRLAEIAADPDQETIVPAELIDVIRSKTSMPAAPPAARIAGLRVALDRLRAAHARYLVDVETGRERTTTYVPLPKGWR